MGSSSQTSMYNSFATYPTPTSTAPLYRYDCFISYRYVEPDAGFARKLAGNLEAAGYTVAIDRRDFAANKTVIDEMKRCVKESKFTLAVISRPYLGRGTTNEAEVIQDILYAAERRRRLIPLLIEPDLVIPTWLYGTVGIDFTEFDPHMSATDRLLRELRRRMQAS